MPQASSMSDTRGMLQAAPIRIELLIKNEANQNRNKKVIIFGVHERRNF